MPDWKTISALLAGVPDLPGARCKGRADLFEATVNEHSKPASRPDPHAACEAALRLCETCPVLNSCRAYVDGLRPSQRPRGVVAGVVITSAGRPMRTRPTSTAGADETGR